MVKDINRHISGDVGNTVHFAFYLKRRKGNFLYKGVIY